MVSALAISQIRHAAMRELHNVAAGPPSRKNARHNTVMLNQVIDLQWFFPAQN
jgi:hypothetical protein